MGFFDRTRAEQARFWFGEEVRQGLLRRLESSDAKAVMETLAAQVTNGELTTTRAAEEALARLAGG